MSKKTTAQITAQLDATLARLKASETSMETAREQTPALRPLIHPRPLTDVATMAPPDVIPTLTARDITDAIRRDSARLERVALTASQKRKNAANAARGQEIIDYYGQMPGMDPDPSTVLTDLLADLMHAVAANPKLRAFFAALNSAEDHYTAERNGDD